MTGHDEIERLRMRAIFLREAQEPVSAETRRSIAADIDAYADALAALTESGKGAEPVDPETAAALKRNRDYEATGLPQALAATPSPAVAPVGSRPLTAAEIGPLDDPDNPLHKLDGEIPEDVRKLAATAAMFTDGHFENDDTIIIDAIMADRASRLTAGVRVRKLEFVQSSSVDLLRRADTEVGTYRVWTHAEANGQWYWEFTMPNGGPIIARGRGEDQAAVVAAAQSHYDAAILSAIDQSPVPSEPVAMAVYRDIFAEITAKAEPLCEDAAEPEKITGYRLPVGPLHRAAGKLGFQMFDGEKHLTEAVAEVTRVKSGLRAFLDAHGAEPLDPAVMRDFIDKMNTEVIPKIEATIQRRQEAAAENRFKPLYASPVSTRAEAAAPSLGRDGVLEEAALLCDAEADKRFAQARQADAGCTDWGIDTAASAMAQDNKAITARGLAIAIRALKSPFSMEKP